MNYLAILYKLAITLWAGGNAIFTLLVTPILFRTEGRDTAARIVGNLFPAYFRWGLACGAVALACRLIGRTGAGRVPVAILVAMLAVVAFQAVYVEPKAADLKKRIVSFETTPREHPLRQEFSRLHGVSAACNLAVLAGGIVLVALP